MEKLVYNAREVAGLLGFSRSFLYELWQRGEGPERTYFGARAFVTRQSLEQWLSECHGKKIVSRHACEAAEKEAIAEVKARKRKKPEGPPKYEGPDRAGNPRKALIDYPLIWLSRQELDRVIADFLESGLRKEFHRKAFEKVEAWFQDNPNEHRKSSEHKTRLTSWGLNEALKSQSESDRAKRSQAVAQAPLPGRPLEPVRPRLPVMRQRAPEKIMTKEDITPETQALLDKILKRKPA